MPASWEVADAVEVRGRGEGDQVDADKGFGGKLWDEDCGGGCLHFVRCNMRGLGHWVGFGSAKVKVRVKVKVEYSA